VRSVGFGVFTVDAKTSRTYSPGRNWNRLRAASLDELVAPGQEVGNRRARGGGGQPDPLRKKKGGRLARRGPEEIAGTLGTVVSLLRGKKAGLRSEEIRKALKLDVREVPRVLKEGLAKKKLKSKGQKRATTYFVA
jgi:hypothetical protein